ncbi:MAG: helix-turn-helix domain-containing protein [Desulfobacteraceae bacterium]|nr:helix-turn-helix domain-containing protein [Desulfobacteraceae bacterium]
MENRIEVRDMREGNYVWMHKHVFASKHITPASKIIYLSLAYFAGNSDQECHPSITRISDISGYSRPTVVEVLKRLRDFGLIDICKAERGKVNRYILRKVTQVGMRVLEGAWKTSSTLARQEIRKMRRKMGG